MTKQIELTQGQVALVDDDWFEYLNQWNWYARWDKTTSSFYAYRHEAKNYVRTYFYMHRVVAQTPKGLICDHINHDTLNNTEKNLRNVTNSQSIMNRRVRQDNKLGEKNISLHSDGKGYNVRFRMRNGEFVKYYLKLDDAIEARNIARLKYHGEFGVK
jgi:hypothetical protein